MHVFESASKEYPKGQRRGKKDGQGAALSDPRTAPSVPCTASDIEPDNGNPSESAVMAVEGDRMVTHKGVTGPKFFHADMLRETDQVSQELTAVEPKGTSAPGACSLPQVRSAAGGETVSLKAASWNLAGVSTKAIETIFAHIVDCDVVAVQEFPKQVAGWKVIEGEKFHGITHQNYSMYRGVGVLYRSDKLQLLKKSSTSRGVWVQLRHIQTQQKITIGSLHLPNNEVKEEVARLLAEFLGVKPGGAQMTVVLGDFNVQFSWRECNNEVHPGVITAKWAALRQGMAEVGLQQAEPRVEQMHLATFHSRKRTVASTQIDGAFTSGHDNIQLVVSADSRHEIGTDHDRVEVMLWLPGGAKQRERVKGGGPRTVKSKPPTITQEQLKSLAKTHTRPLSLGCKFRPSAAVGTLRDMAKAGGTAEAWKQYRVALRKEKQCWREKRIEKASSD